MASSPDPLPLLRVSALPFAALAELGVDAECPPLERALALEAALAREAEELEQMLYAAAGARQPVAVGASGEAGAEARPRLALIQARRDVRNRRATALARAAVDLAAIEPALARRVGDFQSALARRAALDRELESASAVAAAEGHAALARALDDPRIQEGLRLVGRALLEKARRLARTPAAEWGHRERHTALKLVAYLARFASKTSPNGVFCLTAPARWAERPACGGENRVRRREVLLALGEARKITASLAARREIASAIVPRVNPTLRETDGMWRFWKPASLRHDHDDEVLSELRPQPAARRALELCERGLAWPALEEALARELGVAPAAARAFLDRLAEIGLLIAEVELPWSERRPLRALAGAASSAGCNPEWRAALEAVERDIDRMGVLDWPEREALLDQMAARLERLPHHRPLQGDELFRVDAASAIEVALPRDLLPELDRFLGWYARLYAALYPEQAFREAYARRFLARFAADQPIAMLDLVHGVFEPRGEPRPSGFPRPQGSDPDAERRRAIDARVRGALAASARDAAARGIEEVDLAGFDWHALIGSAPVPRHQCGVLFQLAPAAPARRICINAIYPGVGLSVSRLAGLHDVDGEPDGGPIERELRRGWRALEAEGAALAEVSYMHAGRTANAGLRPALFAHEIELPGDRVSPGARALPLADLTVTFESATRRFRLRSRALGREVRPVVSSGISPEGLVAFLLMIGAQDFQPLGYFPGFDVEGISRWPRFVSGEVVVWRRRWTFDAAELPDTAPAPWLAPARRFGFARWRRLHALPRHVFIHTPAEPKPFYVDLESPWLLELLEHRLAPARREPITIHVTEMLPGPDALWVEDPRGRYASEFLVHRAHPGGERA